MNVLTLAVVIVSAALWAGAIVCLVLALASSSPKKRRVNPLNVLLSPGELSPAGRVFAVCAAILLSLFVLVISVATFALR